MGIGGAKSNHEVVQVSWGEIARLGRRKSAGFTMRRDPRQDAGSSTFYF